MSPDPRAGGVDAAYEPILEEALRLFHAGRDRFSLTYSEWGRCYSLCKALVEQVGATAEDLGRVVRVARSRYSVPVTLKLCFDHFSELMAVAEERSSQPKAWVAVPDHVPDAEERCRVYSLLGRLKTG